MKDAAQDKEFEQFWSAYPIRIGRKRAYEKFVEARKRKVAFAAIMSGLERYKAYLLRKAWQKPAHAATWLHQCRWTDEYCEPVKTVQPGQPSKKELLGNDQEVRHANKIRKEIRVFEEWWSRLSDKQQKEMKRRAYVHPKNKRMRPCLGNQYDISANGPWRVALGVIRLEDDNA